VQERGTEEKRKSFPWELAPAHEPGLTGARRRHTTPSVSVGVSELEVHRTALTGHCYRMLGSSLDADDAVQETMVRAWRGLDRFDGRSSLRTWLYRIATNVCLDALKDRTPRARPTEEGPVGSPDPTKLEARPRTHWIEPVPDTRVLPSDLDPGERAILRQSIRLAFVAALQHLPPKQRAALLLADVLGCSSAEIAETLELSVAAVNSALQRARAALDERVAPLATAELTPEQLALVDRYVAAFESYDVDSLTSLLANDVKFSMPPYTLWLSGLRDVRTWMLGPGCACRGSKLVRTSSCGSPAFAQYRQGGSEPWALIVLELAGEQICAITSFLDAEKLFPVFGMPPKLDA
jgi:RNA polymerase sigma-70 factor (ECF subfamily)